jgi:hypothetical protein
VTTESARVYYGEGQKLRADDLHSEQAYLIALDARHLAGEHAAGIVRGLNVGSGILGDRVIQPGIAIDDAGRELSLSVAQPAPDPPAGASLDLWLVYSRRPLRLQQAGKWDCGPTAFQRWREFGLIVTTEVAQGGAPASPAERALYLGRISSKSTTDIRYAALLGSLVKDPGARSLMQIGPMPGHDRNGFVINADDGSGAPTPRLLVDRRGNNVLYGSVTLLDYRACAVVPGPDNKSRILVEAKQPGPAGELIRGDFAFDSAGTYRLQFLRGQGGPREPLTLSVAAGQNALDEFNKTSVLVRLTLLPPVDGARSLSNATIIGRSVALTPCGGMLELCAWPNPPGDAGSGKEPNGLSFLAIPNPQKVTPLPAIYSIKAADNGKPVEQLRLDLGAKKDADPTTRLAIGATDKAVFVSWLTVSGKCGVTLVGGDMSDTNKPPISFNVTGTIEQAPIKPDPTDPEFTNLLVLAWLSGLERSVQATTVVQLAFENLPTLIETGQPWSYSVRATNQGIAPVTGDKLFETRSIAGQTLLTNIANQVIIPAGGNQAFPINHRANEMPAGQLSIEVRMSGKIGNFPWWKSVSTPAPIPVVNSPQIDLSDVPESVPPGAKWDHSYIVKNVSGIAINLSAATITEGSNTSHQPVAQTLHQNETTSFGPVFHPNGISADLPVAISVDFSWENGPVSNVTSRKMIHVSADLAIDFQTPISLQVNTAWSYSLVLRNVGSRPLAIQSLKQRLSSTDFATTPFADIPLTAPINLHQGQSTAVTVQFGIQVPSLTTQVKLEVQPEYKRGGDTYTWEPIEFKEIDVT